MKYILLLSFLLLFSSKAHLTCRYSKPVKTFTIKQGVSLIRLYFRVRGFNGKAVVTGNTITILSANGVPDNLADYISEMIEHNKRRSFYIFYRVSNGR